MADMEKATRNQKQQPCTVNFDVAAKYAEFRLFLSRSLQSLLAPLPVSLFARGGKKNGNTPSSRRDLEIVEESQEVPFIFLPVVAAARFKSFK